MINQEDYELLKELGDKWKWIARDGFKGELNVYNVRPTRSSFKNWWLTNGWSGISKTISPYFFPFIQWTDSEPYFIPDLIKEYEDKGDVGYALKEYAEHVSKFNEKLLTESEEEMKKDKEWLKEKIEEELKGWEAIDGRVDESVIEDVLYCVAQLDEPKVLSQELPVIPKYVAEWIEGNKQSEEKWSDYDKEDAMNDTIHFTIYGLFADYPATNSHVELRKPVLKWLSVDRGNYFKLVNAVRYGYEVEEEPLYRARLRVITDGSIASYLRTQSSDAEDRLKVLEIGSKYIHEDYRHLSEFTENELKRLDIWGSEQWEIEEVE